MVDFDMLETNPGAAIIKVIGVGGAGGNAVAHMIRCNTEGVEFICVNTDAQALTRTGAPVQIHLGDHGRGAGGVPENGCAAAEVARGEIRAAIKDAHMVFITAGMGGGTGTGAAPIVAEVAKELGILTIGVVSKPFAFEGSSRMRVAEQGIAELAKHVDSLVIVLNENIRELVGKKVPIKKCLAAADDVLRNACAGIAEIINVPGLVNVDFEDVRTAMAEQGKAMMGTAIASGEQRAREAAEQAIACPLLEGVDLHGARGVVVNVSGSEDHLTLDEVYEIMEIINAHAAEGAHTFVGTVFDETLGDQLRVTVVATGLGTAAAASTSARPHLVSMPVEMLRTGTDNLPVHNTNNTDSAHGADSGIPAVIRMGRGQAAAQVHALKSAGMDDYDIPAFLRKQAD